MKKAFLMRTQAPYTLNFLIYIQNIYINQQNPEEELRYPYYPNRLIFKDDFAYQYEKLWDEVTQTINKHPINDLKVFYDDKELFFTALFENNPENLQEFHQMYLSYKVWWDSIAGHFATERLIDDKEEMLYLELANTLKLRGIKPQKELWIHLIYDKCLFDYVEISSYFAILPIQDFLAEYNMLVQKILKTIE